MNNNIPNINEFLDKIDPEKTVDRTMAIVQIGTVILGKSVDKIKTELDESENKEIDLIISKKDQSMPNNVFKYLKEIGKLDEFTNILDQITNEVKDDYIKTHLKALTEEKRQTVFIEYPELKILE